MKKMRRVLLIFALFTLLLTPTSVSAASKKTKALKAYKSFMAKKSTSAKFAVVYLDGDSVPELIYYVPTGPIYKIYTWKNGKMKTVYSVDCTEAVSDAVNITHYYKKKGVFLAVPYTGAVGYSGKLYYVYNGSKYRCKLNRSVSPEAVRYFKVSGTKTLKYTGITSAQFSKSLKKLVGTRKATKLKYYKNTTSNRKKRIK